MGQISGCLQCACEYTYKGGALIVSRDYDHEWSPMQVEVEADASAIKDVNGNALLTATP